MPPKRTFIFNGPTKIRDLKGLDLCGAHLHFNGSFTLADISQLNLKDAIVIFNPRGSGGVSQREQHPGVVCTLLTRTASGTLSTLYQQIKHADNASPIEYKTQTREDNKRKRPVEPSVIPDHQTARETVLGYNRPFPEVHQPRAPGVGPLDYGDPEPATSEPPPKRLAQSAVTGIHPARMAMLAQVPREHEEDTERVEESRTGTNASALPFNRLQAGKPDAVQHPVLSRVPGNAYLHRSSSPVQGNETEKPVERDRRISRTRWDALPPLTNNWRAKPTPNIDPIPTPSPAEDSDIQEQPKIEHMQDEGGLSRESTPRSFWEGNTAGSTFDTSEGGTSLTTAITISDDGEEDEPRRDDSVMPDKTLLSVPLHATEMFQTQMNEPNYTVNNSDGETTVHVRGGSTEDTGRTFQPFALSKARAGAGKDAAVQVSQIESTSKGVTGLETQSSNGGFAEVVKIEPVKVLSLA